MFGVSWWLACPWKRDFLRGVISLREGNRFYPLIVVLYCADHPFAHILPKTELCLVWSVSHRWRNRTIICFRCILLANILFQTQVFYPVLAPEMSPM